MPHNDDPSGIASPGCGCDRQDMLHSLISIDEALARIAAHIPALVGLNALNRPAFGSFAEGLAIPAAF